MTPTRIDYYIGEAKNCKSHQRECEESQWTPKTSQMARDIFNDSHHCTEVEPLSVLFFTAWTTSTATGEFAREKLSLFTSLALSVSLSMFSCSCLFSSFPQSFSMSFSPKHARFQVPCVPLGLRSRSHSASQPHRRLRARPHLHPCAGFVLSRCTHTVFTVSLCGRKNKHLRLRDQTTTCASKSRELTAARVSEEKRKNRKGRKKQGQERY